MKKVVLILFLFCAKTLSAQNFYAGIGISSATSEFRQERDVTASTYGGAITIDGQYQLKNKFLSVDLNLVYYPAGEYSGSFQYSFSNWEPPYIKLTTTGYLCFNPLPKNQNILLQVKAGIFYAYMDPYFTSQPGDFGPAFEAYFGCLRIGKKNYIGFDFSWMIGLQKYYINDVDAFPFNDNLSGYSSMTYAAFSLKFFHKF